MVRLRKRWKASRIVFWALSNDFNINISSSWYISSFPSLKIREKSSESSFISLLNSEIFPFIISSTSKFHLRNLERRMSCCPKKSVIWQKPLFLAIIYSLLKRRTHSTYLNLLTNVSNPSRKRTICIFKN